MLDKVIQVEGRKQLNRRASNNFGSGSHPDCRGLTLEELQRIDFSRLDFSEFIEDFKVKFFGKYKQPNSADITARVNGSMSNIRRYDDNPNNPQNNLTGWNLGLKDDSFEADEERRLELERQRREAERLELERRKQLEESEEFKRRVAAEEARKAARRNEIENKIVAQKRGLKLIEETLISEYFVHNHSVWHYYHTGNFLPGPKYYSNYWLQPLRLLMAEARQVWEEYKYHPGFCDKNHILWKETVLKEYTGLFNPSYAWPNPFASSPTRDSFGEVGRTPHISWKTWCDNLLILQNLENNLSSGNY